MAFVAKPQLVQAGCVQAGVVSQLGISATRFAASSMVREYSLSRSVPAGRDEIAFDIARCRAISFMIELYQTHGVEKGSYPHCVSLGGVVFGRIRRYGSRFPLPK